MKVFILYQLTKFGSNRTSTFQIRLFSHFQPILQLDLRWPLTLLHYLWLHEHMKVHILYYKPSLVRFRLQLFKWGHFHIFSLSYNLTSDDLWPCYITFDCMNIWRFTYYIIHQVWFNSDFNFSNEGIFTFSAYLTTWPQMTFDLDIWHLTSSTNEGSHVASMTQLWLKSIKACGR